MVDENLISKKEVLQLTGISYGQFYRWKRKGLIPESWFIRKSTFTGQETFLPRAKVLDRIEKIQSLKDEHSLEELAQMLAPEISGRDFEAKEVQALEWISQEVVAFYEAFRPTKEGYGFHEILFLTVLEKLRKDLDDDQLALVVTTLLSHLNTIKRGEAFRWTLLVGRKAFERSLSRTKRAAGVNFCCLYEQRCLFDGLTETIVRLDLHPLLEDIKLRISKAAA